MSVAVYCRNWVLTIKKRPEGDVMLKVRSVLEDQICIDEIQMYSVKVPGQLPEKILERGGEEVEKYLPGE